MSSNTSPAVPSSPDQELTFSPLLKGLAHFFSIVFHPIFIPLAGTLFIVYSHPYHFANFTGRFRLEILGSVILNTIILPGVTVLLLKPLGFASSVFLRTQKDRIIPYAATMIFYFWVFWAFKNQAEIPPVFTTFLLGNFIAIIAIFLCNIFLKVSMHTVGLGGLLGLMLTMTGDRFFNVALPLIVCIIITGMVATSRMILQAHSNREIRWGVMIGIFSQLLAIYLI